MCLEKEANYMLEKIKEIKRNMILLSIFYLVLGFILVAYPDTSGAIICKVLASFIFLYGIIHIVIHFVFRVPFVFKFDLIQGILGVGLGIYIFMFPDFIMTILPIVLGIIVILDSLMKIQSAFDLKSIGFVQWKYLLIVSCIALICGILMIFYPFASLLTIIQFVGFVLIFNGIYDLIHIVILSLKFKQYKKEVENNIIDEEPVEEEIL